MIWQDTFGGDCFALHQELGFSLQWCWIGFRFVLWGLVRTVTRSGSGEMLYGNSVLYVVETPVFSLAFLSSDFVWNNINCLASLWAEGG